MNILKRTFLSVFFLLLATTLTPVASVASEDGWQRFTLDDGFIVIEVEIDGHPAKAILDSGAAMNLISKRFIKKYGEDYIQSGRVRMRGVFGEDEVDVYTEIPVRMFDSDMIFSDVAVGSLGDADLMIGGGYESFRVNFYAP